MQSAAMLKTLTDVYLAILVHKLIAAEFDSDRSKLRDAAGLVNRDRYWKSSCVWSFVSLFPPDEKESKQSGNGVNSHWGY
jgi:hypothetical protein